MGIIVNVFGREILDSRGNPTVEACVELEDGTAGFASVPSGASTGSFEAVELRDKDMTRYFGKGVLEAVDNINTEIAENIIGLEACDQIELDQELINLDETENKARLGANAMLAVSLAAARAAAKSLKMSFYKYIGGVNASVLPVPMMNIINGGEHADNNLDIQEFMILPVGADSFHKALKIGAEIYHTLKNELKAAKFVTNVGDEGGFAPSLKSAKDALEFITKSIERAGYVPGEDVMIGLDVAATVLYNDGKYIFKGEGKTFTPAELVKYYEDLVYSYPIISIEDGMSEEDFEGWAKLTKALGKKIQLVGDDVFVTNKERINRGINENIANAVLIKPNQIGTLTETLEAIEISKNAGYKTIISHRSGETEDSYIADISVALNSGQIKSGAPARSDRIAKYNRLLYIEDELGGAAKFLGRNALIK